MGPGLRRTILIGLACLLVGGASGFVIGRAGTGRSARPQDSGSTSLPGNGLPDSPELPGTVPVQSPSGFPPESLFVEIYELRNRAVVNITTQSVRYNFFFEPVPTQRSTGSGIIIDERGFILTNHHVIEGADRVLVTLADGALVDGEIVGTDRENDLALVRIDPGDRVLEPVPFGRSTGLRTGQTVLAIGNPFGLDRTLTTGIVSGTGRSVRQQIGSADFVIQNMIQTDASINPGNSGGPLLNSRGELVGINTMIYSPSGGSVGIGFAVPIDTAARVLPDLIEFGRVRRGWIDIVPIQLFPDLVRFADLPVDRGILVSQVVPGGNADSAGLRGGDPARAVRYERTIIRLGGDIIVELDGTPVSSLGSLFEALEDNRPGETVEVVYLRNGRERTGSVVLSDRPEQYRLD